MAIGLRQLRMGPGARKLKMQNNALFKQLKQAAGSYTVEQVENATAQQVTDLMNIDV